ncbi:hypothetical protein BC830DRAFT_129752 [Chytriomyces sp. MP71]|nr:hypothetical protein BC830DRAFT_129752 [Chytriomyces sp. MP71]
MGSVSGAFEMTQLYPARVFSPADEESTLKDLDLVPSASLVVKYLHGTASSYPSIGSDNSVVASFVRPFQALLAWLAALFTWIATRVQGGSTVSHTGASISVDRNALADSGDSAGADVGATSSSSSSSSGAANAKFSSLAELRRRQQREGKEKDNSTYNGNSTAQDF